MLKQRCNGHDETRFTIAAHCHLFIEPRALNWVGTVSGQTLDRRHVRTLEFTDRDAAAHDGAAIDHDGTCAAIVTITAIFGPG